MNGARRSLADAGLSRSPAQPVFHWRASRRLAVLAYHGIDDPERFEQHLDYLRRRMHPVSLETVLGALRAGGGLPPRACLITFDDGHRSVLESALPLLRERSLPAAVFVVAGLIGTDHPFWWAEVKDLARAGGTVSGLSGRTPDDLVRALKRVPDDRRLDAIDELRGSAARTASPVAQLLRDELRVLESYGVAVGNHSMTHACLSRCTDRKILDEVHGAHEELTSALGHEPKAFAYPDGDRDQRVATAVATAGYEAAFLFDHRMSPPAPPDPLRISRLRVNSDTHLDRFRTIVSGLHPAVHHALGRA